VTDLNDERGLLARLSYTDTDSDVAPNIHASYIIVARIWKSEDG